MPKLSLSSRVMLGLVVFGAALSYIATEAADISSDVIEETILNEFLAAEMAGLVAQTQQGATPPAGREANFRTYVLPAGATPESALPEALRELTPGFHEDIVLQDREHYVQVKQLGGRRYFVAYDITHIEEKEDEQELLFLLGSLIIIGVSLLIGYFFARLLVSPIQALARQVAGLDPAARGERMTDFSRVEEVAIIASAINGYMERLDGFVEREQEFSATVSHELRTPIAVISTSADVLEALPNLPRGAARPISRIERATQDMEEVMTALLYLAKETPFSGNGDEACHLDKIVLQVVQDHSYLTKNKKLAVKVLSNEPTLVSAPYPILVIAIGNIVRNAIEHTEQGSVEIRLQDGVLDIRNSGKNLSPEKVAQLFHERFRSENQQGEGKGLGIYIIKRICTRFGWDISIEGDSHKRTAVRLDFSSHVVSAGHASQLPAG